ncbi:MAG: sodium:calcium antiporter [Chlamydiales bacterium]
MTIAFFSIILGMIGLYFGGICMLHFCVGVSQIFRLTISFVSTILVAFVTSLPEVVTTVIAQSKEGLDDVAMGNVIGSNIINIGIILSVSLLISPYVCNKNIRYFFGPLSFAIHVALLLFLWNGVFGIGKANLFILGLILYVIVLIKKSKNHSPIQKTTVKKGMIVVYGIGAILALVIGAESLVRGSMVIGRHFGISERILGLTVIALGTSLPELATSLVAAWKKEEEIAVANVIGSNILNPLLILPLAAWVRPITFSKRFVRVDLPFLIAISGLLCILMLFRPKLSRVHGATFFFLYVLYFLWIL